MDLQEQRSRYVLVIHFGVNGYYRAYLEFVVIV